MSVNVMIVESSLGRGSKSFPALLFADCVVSICFYLIIPLLLVKSQFWLDTRYIEIRHMIFKKWSCVVFVMCDS